MSETARIYKGYARRKKKSRFRGPGLRIFRRFVFILVIVTLVVSLWVTRDSHDIEEFMPNDVRISVFLPEFLDRRIKVAKAQVWNALPEDSPLAQVPNNIMGDADLPEWVLRNLIGPETYLHGSDTVEFTDALLITKMSPVGAFAERIHRFSLSVKRDKAGGLRIYTLPAAELYYATRGRVLMVSRSRRALIRTLTLSEAERGDMPAALDENDISGRITLTRDDPGGDWFDAIDFALRIDANDMRLDFRAHLKPKRNAELEARSLGHVPGKLAIPMEGPISISTDFGVPLKELSAIIADLFDGAAPSADQWEQWERNQQESPNAASLATLLGPLGPQLRLTWLGFDTNEIFPVPTFAAQLGGDPDRIIETLHSLPGPPTGPAFTETYAYYDPETDRMHAPIASGPSLQPSAAWHGQNLLFSTSNEVLEQLLTRSKVDQYLSQPANLYIAVHPGACIEALSEAGALLAKNDLLKNHTPKTFKEQTRKWQNSAQHIQQITAMLSLADGTLYGQLNVLSPPQ